MGKKIKKTSRGMNTIPGRRYTIGVMKTSVREKSDRDFSEIVDGAAEILKNYLSEELDVDIQVFEFIGPYIPPTASSYSPFDFLRLGLVEKIERQIPFLLVVTDAVISSSEISYALAFPSQIMNIGILSINRLSPVFWGKEPSPRLTSKRLAGLMLHTIGHLLNLKHHPSPTNALYDFPLIENLEKMEEITEEQNEHIKKTLPLEARDSLEEGPRWKFILGKIIEDWPAILRAVIHANPLKLLTQLPTMITAAFSVIIVLFFTAEIWDVASTVELGQLLIFSLIALAAGTIVLYRAFRFTTVLTRRKRIAESIVITTASTVLSLLVTMVLIYAVFLITVYISTKLIFPVRLMSTWPTVDAAVRTIDHIKLSMFLASVGILVGSIGGQADSGQIVKYILFLDEET